MKIAYIIPQWPGQTHIFLWREMKALKTMGVEVEVVSTRHAPADIVCHDWSEEASRQTTYLTPTIADIVMTDYRSGGGSSKPRELTQREREVLQLVAEGHTTKSIAHNLNVSNKMIESHRQHVMQKLGLHSVAELTKYALQEGITTLDV